MFKSLVYLTICLTLGSSVSTTSVACDSTDHRTSVRAVRGESKILSMPDPGYAYRPSLLDPIAGEQMVHVDGPGPIVSHQWRYFYEVRSVTSKSNYPDYKIVDDVVNPTTYAWGGLGGTTYTQPNSTGSSPISDILGSDRKPAADLIRELTPYSYVAEASETLVSPKVTVGAGTRYRYSVGVERVEYVLSARSMSRTWSWFSWNEWKVDVPTQIYTLEFAVYYSTAYTARL